MSTSSTRIGSVILVAAALAFGPSLALASPQDHHANSPMTMQGMKAMQGMHHGSMEGNYQGGHGKSHGKKHGKDHQLKPHNAAIHFLMMAEKLSLNDSQIHQLTIKRDSYIEAHEVHTAQLKAAQSDLKRVLHADDINLNDAKALLSTIGQLESILWPAFVEQLHDIKAMLSDGQRARLKAMHKGSH